MRKLLSLIPLAVLAAGCASGDNALDTSNPAAAEKAAAAMPKTASDLPKDMPPAAQKSAEGAMRANAAMTAQQTAQMEAMKKATQGAH